MVLKALSEKAEDVLTELEMCPNRIFILVRLFMIDSDNADDNIYIHTYSRKNALIQ